MFALAAEFDDSPFASGFAVGVGVGIAEISVSMGLGSRAQEMRLGSVFQGYAAPMCAGKVAARAWRGTTRDALKLGSRSNKVVSAVLQHHR